MCILTVKILPGLGAGNLFFIVVAFGLPSVRQRAVIYWSDPEIVKRDIKLMVHRKTNATPVKSVYALLSDSYVVDREGERIPSFHN